jgi:hypothetical protein
MKNNVHDKISTIEDRISASQNEFEEKMTDTLDNQVKGVTTVVNSRPRNFAKSSTVRCKYHDEIYKQFDTTCKPYIASWRRG